MKRSLIYYGLCVTLFLSGSLKGQSFVVWNNGQDIHINEGIQVVVNNGNFINNRGFLHNDGRLTINGDFVLNDSVESNNLINEQPAYQVLGTWDNNADFIAGNSRTTLYGGNQQITGSSVTTFYDLDLTGNGVKELDGIDARIVHELNLTINELATKEQKAYVDSDAEDAILYVIDSGFVSSTGNGRLVRKTAAGLSYIYPLGQQDLQTLYYRPLLISTDNNHSIEGRLAYLDAGLEGKPLSQKAIDIEDLNSRFFHLIESSDGNDATGALAIAYESATEGTWEDIGQWITNTSTSEQWKKTFDGADFVLDGLEAIATNSWLYNGNNAHILLKVADEIDFEFPTAFDPQSPFPENQNFTVIDYLGTVDILQLQVFNRWGTLVYDSERDGGDSWDGTFRGELQQAGNYVYLATLIDNSGGQIGPINGNIILVR
ncbi:MAG: gliding motility-associated C-terminal domain-containing protein [Chitinophagales bacterium]